MSKVVVSTSSFGRHDAAPLDRLRTAGHEVTLNPHGRRLEPDEIREMLCEAEGLIAGTETLDRETLESAGALKVISRCGAGTDQVDLDSAKRLGIRVCRTSEAHVAAVAELTLGGILALLRHITTSDRQLRTGQWRKPMGRLLAGRTLGIVGLGRTGRRLVSLVRPFELRVLATDPRPDPGYAAAHAVEYTDLENLLRESDIVSLHLEYSPETHRLLDGSRLAVMKSDAVLVNCARGALVDEQALIAALAAERLAGAYLDVFEEEPYSGALVEFDNVVLTPHIGSYAVESRVEMELEAVDQLLRGLSETTR